MPVRAASPAQGVGSRSCVIARRGEASPVAARGAKEERLSRSRTSAACPYPALPRPQRPCELARTQSSWRTPRLALMPPPWPFLPSPRSPPHLATPGFQAPPDGIDPDLAFSGLQHAIPVRPSNLPTAILWTVAQDEERLNFDAIEELLSGEEPPVALPIPAVLAEDPARLNASLAFAEHIAYAPIMPVERSPVRGEALSSLLDWSGLYDKRCCHPGRVRWRRTACRQDRRRHWGGPDLGRHGPDHQ
jgi:hypothetical protein